MTVPDIQVRAAGGLLRRQTDKGPEFCLIHRPTYLDWTIPKGKLDPGETHLEAALREVEEETGFRGERGPELPATSYEDAEGRTKQVRYWLMTTTDEVFRPNNEVDEIRWVSAADAMGLLTYAHDRAVVTAALGFDAPIFLVRHAKAGSRSEWAEDDRIRPLSKKGRAQAEVIARALSTLGITRIVSSPYLRCVQTVRPLALTSGIPIEEREELAEGARTEASWELLAGVDEATALCSHGDVIPALVERAEKEGAGIVPPQEFSKGSVWRFERVAGSVVGGTQLVL